MRAWSLLGRDLKTRWRRRIRAAVGAFAALAMVVPICGVPRGVADPLLMPVRASLSAELPMPPVLAIESYEAGGDVLLRMDRLEVASGNVTVRFTNSSKTSDEILAYPMQDVSALLAALRSGANVNARAYLKDVVGATGPVAPGASVTVTMMSLAPGLYEIGSYIRLLGVDGSITIAHDRGELLTLNVTAGNVGAATPGTVVTMTMRAGDHATWLLVPDAVVAAAGDVTFVLTNRMGESHDLVIAPLGDTSSFVRTRLADGEADYRRIGGQELVSDLPPGRSASKTIALRPGMYLAACFMVSTGQDGTVFVHADRGQRFTFRVL